MEKLQHKVKYKSGLKLVQNANITFENVIVDESKRLKCDSFKDINDHLLNKNYNFSNRSLKKITLEYWIDIIQQKKRELNQKNSKNKKVKSKLINKKYSLSIFRFFTKDLFLISISHPIIIILFLISFLKILFYPFLVFKEIILYILRALISEV